MGVRRHAEREHGHNHCQALGEPYAHFQHYTTSRAAGNPSADLDNPESAQRRIGVCARNRLWRT
jgi:hypothetical protein